MRSIKLYIATSLDGYIARRSGEIDWLFDDQDYGYSDFLATIDTMIMGRKTYEQVLTFGEYPYPDKKNYVVSNQLQGKPAPYAEFVEADQLKPLVEELRRSDGKDIWLVGGAQVIRFFMQHRFVDELILSIHPIVLGDGIPLFLNDPQIETLFQLKAVKPFNSGLVQLSYSLAEGSP